jgi:parallel beta-helix repeat protein
MKKSLYEKGLILVIIALFVGASTITTSVGIIEKNTTFKVVRSPGYIQDLIDNASDGDTIDIPSGIYYENIIINKSISLVGEDKNITIIDGSGNGSVISISVDWVNISGFTIQKSGDGLVDAGINIDSNYNTISGNNIIFNNENGIYLSFSNNNRITGNFISSNVDDGIDFDDSNDNIITENTITYNIPEGIQVEDSINNNITNNNISNNGLGIYLKESSDNNIITGNSILNNHIGMKIINSANNIMRNNIMVNNSRNFGVSGNELEEFINDVDESNKVNGKSIYYWVSVENTEVPLDAGYVALISCKNIKVENLELMNNSQGVLLAETRDTTITGNIITHTNEGINLYKSNSSNIVGNDITSNSKYGIRFYESSSNSATGNNVTDSIYGVYLEDSKINTISGNIIQNNNRGVYLSNSKLNIIKGNNISKNSYGIYLDGPFWPIKIKEHLFCSVLNIIIKNNFIYNKLDAFFRNSRINRWSQNYWNRSRLFPHLIYGEIYWVTVNWLAIIEHNAPWIPQIDRRPAIKPYDI